MQCQCGGTAILKISVKTVDEWTKYKLAHKECTTCKRVGNYVLFVNRKHLASGEEARAMFEEK